MMNTIEKLKRFVIANKAKPAFPYINLTDDNRYAGWVNASGSNGDNLWLKLNLKKEWDQFCLFALASAWSRTGPWENAVYFVKIIRKNFSNVKDIDCVALRKHGDSYVEKHWKELIAEGKTRKKLAFRDDLCPSIKVLCKNWNGIKQQLDKSGKSGDWEGFVRYMRGIKGLGSGERSMNMKIALVLRELRCQNVYSNIPGDLCCVPDERVREAYKMIGSLPGGSPLYISASRKIYKDFGDLYDIPAFAYDDMQ
jgi:hypothetical protein